MAHIQFYKFNTHREFSDTLDADHRRICDILKVPYSIWSFFELKMKHIKDLWEDFPYIIEWDPIIVAIDGELIENFDYSAFEGVHLTFNEKFFIFHIKDILDMQQKALCVSYSSPSLRYLCLKNVSLNDTTLDLPKTVVQDLYEMHDRRMPTYNLLSMREKFFDNSGNLNHLFSEIDRIHSKEFVVWFQNDILIHKMLDLDSVVIISSCFMHDEDWFICMHCLKVYLEDHKIDGIFERIYFEVDEDLLNDVQGPDLLTFVRNSSNWCNECKRVPLFYFTEDYDNVRKKLKTEHYV